MASEAPRDPGRRPKGTPTLGLLLGTLLVVPVLWLMLKGLRESEFLRQVALLWNCSMVIVVVVGGGIGGVMELLTRGRAAEIPRFLGVLLRGALWVAILFGSLFVGGWLGGRLNGSVGHDIGTVISAALIVPVWYWFGLRSSGKNKGLGKNKASGVNLGAALAARKRGYRR